MKVFLKIQTEKLLTLLKHSLKFRTKETSMSNFDYVAQSISKAQLTNKRKATSELLRSKEALIKLLYHAQSAGRAVEYTDCTSAAG